jgi:hypothetical protein
MWALRNGCSVKLSARGGDFSEKGNEINMMKIADVAGS